MKTYRNGMKATEFSGKQISVIYRAAKAGDLKVEKWVSKEFYNLADFYNFDDNGSIERAESKVLAILEAVFAGDFQKAQELVDQYTETEWNLLGAKAQKRADRNLVA
jgi:hypothetical protein